MPLPDFLIALVERKVGEFCEKRVPPHVRSKITLSFEVRGTSITVFENRAPWREGLREWTHFPVAQLRYDDKRDLWTLYCRDRNRKWWKYESLSPMQDIEKLLEEIDKDPTGIFWG